MAAGKGWLPRVVTGVKLNEATNDPIEFDMVSGDWQSMPACFRYDAQDCKITRFDVAYDNRTQRTVGAVSGIVIYRSRGRRRSKVVSRAIVEIFKAGEKQPLASRASDKNGQFEFQLEPGIYELLVRQKGLQDASVKEFLVPRENVTRVTVETAPVGWIQLCVDEAYRAMRGNQEEAPISRNLDYPRTEGYSR